MKEKLEKLKVYIDLVLDFLAFKNTRENLNKENLKTSVSNTFNKIKNIFKK